MKIIIIGGVAGGATTATRLRRLNENAQIIMIERGKAYFFCQLWTSLLYWRCYSRKTGFVTSNSRIF